MMCSDLQIVLSLKIGLFQVLNLEAHKSYKLYLVAPDSMLRYVLMCTELTENEVSVVCGC